MMQARVAKAASAGFRLDIEFELQRRVTALHGPSGAGKTLALECLAGFAQPDAGRILLDDAIVFDGATGVSAAPAGRRCGYVRQRGSLFPHMTLRRNLAFAAVRKARLERSRRVADMLERFELMAAQNQPPASLSAAQRLRGEIARALLAEPKLLMIDERGLDLALLRTTLDAFAGPLLIVTGDLNLCCAAADDLLLLEAGKLLQSGDARNVADRPSSAAAARLLGFANLFEGAIAALDPGRDTSRMEFEGFALAGLYLPGRFRGDRITMAVRPERLRVHSGDAGRVANGVPASLIRASRGARDMRLEFSGGIIADVPHAEFERQKDNKSWQVEFPAEALRVF